MKTYLVDVYYSHTRSVEVEAESEEDAGATALASLELEPLPELNVEVVFVEQVNN